MPNTSSNSIPPDSYIHFHLHATSDTNIHLHATHGTDISLHIRTNPGQQESDVKGWEKLTNTMQWWMRYMQTPTAGLLTLSCIQAWGGGFV